MNTPRQAGELLRPPDEVSKARLLKQTEEHALAEHELQMWSATGQTTQQEV